MSREIKFRAWDKFSKRMGAVNFIRYSDSQYAQVSARFKQSGKNTDEWFNYGGKDGCDNMILMESTGLYDKNCKEIFEGDIVVINNQRFYIHFEIGSFMLVRCSGETDMYAQFKDCWNDDVYPLSQYYWNDEAEEDAIYSLEVIGNIHENPELLEAVGGD